ncbi:MFS general substrate transporter [Stereum hirsutum FP-91666 SS1]|uniref:MFS general substrate transporter n=1 Tax=Stereum hirsutum (strain FP-91666) TaxID=721885 RepID=UPI000440FC59|nr:MFS general substrate transporter [Stereum hirsutum FP-91666 SS1]EIM90950.1 MFS general substrate transporter [Stereum hirsutum FP-91666 SS1]
MTAQDTTDEETPLLQQEGENHPKKRTAIPWAQVSLLLVLQLSEPLTSQVIYPFAPEFVRKSGVTHGDESRVGTYVGLMQSIFYATQAMTVLHWSRTSDIVGRKPVILTGLFGLSISMYCFGLSRTYWGAVASRSFNGALNGNIGVLKSMVAEIADPTNLAQIYALLPISWLTGSVLGPMVGGSLSRPAERFPDTFGHSEFLKKYPYFLACAVPATFSALAWVITFTFLKETVRSPTPIRRLFTSKKSKQELADEASAPPVDEADKPYPIHALLVPRVLIASANYASLSLMDIAYRAVQPLFFSTPIEMGGLGLSPPVIGYLLAFFGLFNGLFQIFFFARINDHFGTKKVFVAGMLTFIPVFALFPIMSALAKEAQAVTTLVWIIAGFQTLLSIAVSLSYGCSFIFIAASSPNKASLGATNGIAQLGTSVMRTIGPAAANSLFSLSMKHGILNGYFVYLVLTIASGVAVAFSTTLPTQVWRK